MSKLFSPLALAASSLDNRVVVSPMSQYSAEKGCANDWHFVHYGALANSGAGLVMIESTHVDDQGCGTAGCLGLYTDAQEAALGRVVATAKKIGSSKIGLQLNHSGRKASMSLPWAETRGPLGADQGGWTTLSASDVPFGASWPAPNAATQADMDRLKAAFADSARRADRIGIDVLELHAAHGYLLHSFLSPLANNRDDEYGGSLENRLRFPLEVFDAIRAVWPKDKPLGVKVSSTDWADAEGGADFTVALAFVKALEAAGCDYVCMSSGAATAEIKVPVAPGYQLQFAEAMRKEVGIPVFAVGLIYDANDAESIIVEEKADAVAIARGFLDNPHWAYQASNKLGGKVKRPQPYSKSAPGAWPGAK